MTPGLASFVVSGDGAGAWDDILSGVLTALGQEFTVVSGRGGAPGGTCRRTWFDTFDWRLYRVGLALEHVAAHRGGELRMTSANPAIAGRGAATGSSADGGIPQPVTGWPASRPHPPQDLPEGPIAARVANLVAPRVLFPVVTVSSTASVRRLLNADGKTVARLLIERPLMAGRPASPVGQPGRRAGHADNVGHADNAGHAGRQVALAPRLTITEVRGYPGQARRAARIVAAAPGMVPAAEPMFVDALRALGRRPGDYSNKVDAKITADMTAAEAAAVILLRLLDTIEANVPGVLRDFDTEFLHDLRVSVRRTRSALKLFGDVLATGLTGDDIARFAAEFKWVGDLTTPTRDLDVHLLGFEETARTLRAAKPDDLEPFRAYLKQRRLKEYRALARGLRSPRFTELTRDWRSALARIRDNSKRREGAATVRSGPATRRAGETASTLAAGRTRQAFVKAAKRGAAITPASPHDALHDLRKRCKELRYMLEFFAPLHDPAAYGKVIADLKRLQDCLGEFQDTEVQIGEIRALATSMLAAGGAPAVTLLAMGEVAAGLAARQQAARADFERRFAAFAGADGQRRMALLLRGGAA